MDRYGRKAAERTPRVRKTLGVRIPVGAGTDATRVASYNPWVSLHWFVTGKTSDGSSMYPDKNCLRREKALRLYTQGNSWFSSAPLDVVKASRAGVPFEQAHNACQPHGCAQGAHPLLAGINFARNRYAEFFGSGCDCFAF